MNKEMFQQNCSEELRSKVEKICLQRKLKFTDSRKKVFEIISQNHGMVKAYDILSKMKTGNPNIKPPIVYRALDFLIEHNFIHKINSLNSYTTCYHILEKGLCFFLICLKCDIIEEVLDESFSKLVKKSSKEKKFLAQNSSLEIRGICSSCLNR